MSKQAHVPETTTIHDLRYTQRLLADSFTIHTDWLTKIQDQLDAMTLGIYAMRDRIEALEEQRLTTSDPQSTMQPAPSTDPFEAENP